MVHNVLSTTISPVASYTKSWIVFKGGATRTFFSPDPRRREEPLVWCHECGIPFSVGGAVDRPRRTLGSLPRCWGTAALYRNNNLYSGRAEPDSEDKDGSARGYTMGIRRRGPPEDGRGRRWDDHFKGQGFEFTSVFSIWIYLILTGYLKVFCNYLNMLRERFISTQTGWQIGIVYHSSKRGVISTGGVIFWLICISFVLYLFKNGCQPSLSVICPSSWA